MIMPLQLVLNKMSSIFYIKKIRIIKDFNLLGKNFKKIRHNNLTDQRKSILNRLLRKIAKIIKTSL